MGKRLCAAIAVMGLRSTCCAGSLFKGIGSLSISFSRKKKNPVVSSRASKLQVSCAQSVSNKVDYLKAYLAENQKTSQGLVYVGNDLNDLAAMRLSGFSIAPSDAHPLIQRQANLVLQQKGGVGFIRAFVEKLLGIDQMSIDEIAQLFLNF